MTSMKRKIARALAALLAGFGSAGLVLADPGQGSPDLAPAEITLGPAPTRLVGAAALAAAQDRIAAIQQNGEGLTAHIRQDGAALEARILQTGFDHTASITQQGSSSEALIMQSGSRNQADITQFGAANLALIEQAGSDKRSSIVQHGQSTTVLVHQY
ncbi:hypothetical protein [Pseudomonas sp. OIL-1]|uniref:hypothetical protein n=1 Tax=Pseudomonas sp. OIL-1 TaxID=2706126 RepID=UPI0013A7632B|nr:hypothetical protein [Pseudomonas sp. OIL-1]QIB49836.1 hypothetical protein G3M63_01420 [Pseudomonas sp. OIL-1]